MKKFLKTIASVLLTISLVACSSGNKETAKTTEESNETKEKLKIIAIVNGTLGDKSFFDSLKEGMDELAKRDNIETKVVETGFDETKWEPAILDASDADYDIIVAGTWQMADYVSKVAEQYPDKKYIVYDTAVDYTDGKNKNVYSIEYKQNEGSYLAGAVAAKMSKSGNIGYIGGMDIPVINDFLVGYIEGAQYVNKDIKVAVSYIGNFSDAGKGKELAFAQFNQGVDVVFPAASTAGNGALEGAKEKGVYSIGVDSDQAVLFKEAGDTDMANLIATSVLKEVGTSIVRAIDLELEGKLPWGAKEVLGIKEGAIGIAQTEIYQSVVPEDVKKLVTELEGKIKSGEITVKSAFGIEPEELNEIRNSVKP